MLETLENNNAFTLFGIRAKSATLFGVRVKGVTLFGIRAYGSGKENSPMCETPEYKNYTMKFFRHISFVECPIN